MRRHPDLVLVTAAAGLCGLVAALLPFEAVRVAAAVPLCLFLPGYAISAAAFASDPLERGQALLFTVGLSVTTLATGALILDLFPGGVRRGSWAALLFVVVLAACAIAARRREPRKVDLSGLVPRLSPLNAVLLLGASLCAIAALVLSSIPLPAHKAVGYTQLWMLPVKGAAGPGVRVGVESIEQEPVAYKLTVHQLGVGAPVSSRLVLDPGQESVRFVPAEPKGKPVRFVGLLYREDRPGVIYRRVSGWVRGS